MCTSINQDPAVVSKQKPLHSKLAPLLSKEQTSIGSICLRFHAVFGTAHLIFDFQHSYAIQKMTNSEFVSEHTTMC